MYSETAGVSYENPEPPEAQDSQQDATQPEAELRRRISYPEAPQHPEAAAPGGPAGLSDPADAEPPTARIDDLLEDPQDEDDSFDLGSLDEGAPDGDSPTDHVPAVNPLAIPPEPSRPRSTQPMAASQASTADHAEADRKGAFRIVRDGATGASPAQPPQPGRQRVLDIVMDARMRYWRERVAIMIVVGLLFGRLIGNWIVGLTLAILAGIAHAFWRSPSVASIPPGVKLDKAQRITQRKLARMERAGYRALHMRPIPGSEDIIDHLVVGPTGVYAIDSERWSAKLPIRTRNGKQLWVGPNSQKGRLEHARSEADRAADLLSARLGQEITVRPGLAIYGPHIPWDIAVIREVDVFNGERLRKYLKRRSRIREVAKLSRDEVVRIYEAAELALPFATSPHEVTPVG